MGSDQSQRRYPAGPPRPRARRRAGPASSRSRAGSDPRCRSTARASSTRRRPCLPCPASASSRWGSSGSTPRGRVVRRGRSPGTSRARSASSCASTRGDRRHAGGRHLPRHRAPARRRFRRSRFDVETEGHGRARPPAPGLPQPPLPRRGAGRPRGLGRRQLPAEPRLRGDAGAGDRRHRRGGRDRAPDAAPGGRRADRRLLGSERRDRPPDPPERRRLGEPRGAGLLLRRARARVEDRPLPDQPGAGRARSASSSTRSASRRASSRRPRASRCGSRRRPGRAGR